MSLVLLLLLLPVVDLFLLVWIGRQTSWGLVLAVVLGGFVVGGSLLRHVARNSLPVLQAGLAAGRSPGTLLGSTAAAAIAAVFFILPGVITDALAVLVLIPVTRRFIALWVLPRLTGHVEVRGFSTFAAHDRDAVSADRVIDVRVVDAEESAARRLGDSSGD